MSSAVSQVGSSSGLPAFSYMVQYLLKLAALAAVDAFALMLASGVWGDGNWFLAIAIVLTTVTVNIINLVPSLWPVRWISPALALMGLLTIYPLLYTFYVSITNFSDGHRYTKIETLDLLADRKYLPEGAANYRWTPFRNQAGEYGLWLVDTEGNTFFTAPGEALREVVPGETGDGPFSDDGIPSSLDGYTILEGGERFQALAELQEIQFGTEEHPIGIKGRNEAGDFQQLWVFDEERNALINMETNVPYKSDDDTGDFVAPDGTKAPLGYWVPIGLRNFKDIIDSPVIRGPLVRVFAWTFSYALLSVMTSFAVGLIIAVLLNENFLGVRYVRSALLIPWAIPGMISILIWRGMFNPNVGLIPELMENWFGWAPLFLNDPFWAKFSIILVNLWLAYPYFMLICSGALQSISSSIYEAAEVDGAGEWKKFWNLTLPLVLVSVGPLLIASFIYNFNNFLLIEALTEGKPKMIGTNSPPVGHTDNLMTYTYRFAFSADGTKNFGFASAIAVVIFIMVGIMTLVQFRLTRRWEEIGENV